MATSASPGLKLLETTNSNTNELRRLSTFLEVSQTLASASNQKTAFHQVLGILERHHRVVRSTVALLNSNDEIEVVAAVGPPGGKADAKFRLGEGITGRVVQSGKPIVVPRVSREPMFLRRTSDRPELAREEISYVCVPILLNRRAVGALGADFRFKADRDFDRTVKFLGVVASLMAQAIRIQRVIDAERDRLREENTHLKLELRERYDFSNILGTSGPMRLVYEQVAQVARTDTTVLVRGESGTGKELIAQAIHYNSLRAKRPFIKVSCAALPESLIESELFGYEKGAFTGAQTTKKGRFELAEGGTLFLDEIGELNLSTQIKLLRVLQGREFERLGGTKTLRANVRMIAATNKDIEKAIADGSFRDDLYYRLNVFAIFIPPLRERKPDLLLLADHFLEKASLANGKHIKRISTPAIDMLMAYHWPGNVRELENAIERAVVVCDGQVVHAHHLPPTLQTAAASGTVMSLSLEDAIAAYEKDLIQDALKTSRGNRAKAARLLNTTGRIMNYKVRQLGIDWRRFKK
ncbi:MAG TPA: sigma 54-interacting transcriptional regulator [Vicinamibacterales bacterium]|nr:sigma 54-interacting transcriptional regulator [Vicinamibacterales bacterium]